jgi:uncharacterized protein YndB with AHSA1/START domain
MIAHLRRLWDPVEVRRTIPASRDRVYELLADPETYPKWLVGADHMRAVDPDFPRPGSSFHHSVGKEPVTVDDRTDSLEAEPDRHLALLVHAGPFHARVDFELVTRGTDQTEVRFTEVPVGPFAAVTPLLRPSLHARNVVSLQKLCDLAVA